MQMHKDEDAFMVPGMGAQPVPVKEWVSANDNEPNDNLRRLMRGQLTAEESAELDEALVRAPAGFIAGMTGEQLQAVADGKGEPDYGKLAQAAVDRFHVVHETLAKSERAMPEMSDHDLERVAIETGFEGGGWLTEKKKDEIWAWLTSNRTNADFQSDERVGPYIATATGGKFFPLDPRPSEVNIRHIARAHSMTCRYGGSVWRFFSVAEHATLISRCLVKQYGKRVALAGLLHDSPETYTGFGDVVSPVKAEFPFIGAIEDNIYRKAIAPHFGLPLDLPEVVHAADMRIRGNEVANLVPMAWHEEYDNPLPVPLMYWSPAEAEEEFLATYTALTGEVV